MTDNREPIGVQGDWIRTTWTQADPLAVDEEPWPRDVDPEPYATVDEGNSGAVIVWMAGAIVAALIVAVAVWVVAR